MKYGVVMMTTDCGARFQRAITSLANSDPCPDHIVVAEEGVHAEAVCDKLCKEIDVTLVKIKTWDGTGHIPHRKRWGLG